ncbi:MAG: type II toxin-antitoxin system VapC family toxin [Gammaproteobacteria bacterium]|nr:type II toxin-antitoxin system VapC family toxin [Gammaproteobacteria bacterium]
MIVVDTNIVAYLYLPGPLTAAAEALLAREPRWAAPLLWRSELRNVLASQVAQRHLALDDACAIQREAEDLLAGAEYEVDSLAVLHLAARSRCSAYDCEFAVLAEALGTELYTADRQLLKAFPGIARRLATS